MSLFFVGIDWAARSHELCVVDEAGAIALRFGLAHSERGISAIETKDDKLMLTRNNDYIMLKGKFPRLTNKNAKARLGEIKRWLRTI